MSKSIVIINAGPRLKSLQRGSSTPLKALTTRFANTERPEWLSTAPRVKTEALQLFSQQLSALLAAGVPLLMALEMLSEQTEHKALSTTINELRNDINGGSSFTKALARFPRIFPESFVAMIRSGEAGGQLAAVLKMLATHLKTQNSQNKKLKSAIVYPRFVFIFFMLLLAAVLIGLVPQFKETFENFGSELPKATEMILNVSQFLINNVVLEIALTVALILAFKKLKATPKGLFLLDRLYLRMPVIGDLIVKVSISRFCRTMAVSLASGVQLLDGLEIAGRTVENRVFAQAIVATQKGVLAGDTLSSQLGRNPIFPALVVKMVSTGEESGSLEIMLNNLADLYDTHVETRIVSITSIIEPALMVGLGIIAVIVIMALYLPIFKLGDLNF